MRRAVWVAAGAFLLAACGASGATSGSTVAAQQPPQQSGQQRAIATGVAQETTWHATDNSLIHAYDMPDGSRCYVFGPTYTQQGGCVGLGGHY